MFLDCQKSLTDRSRFDDEESINDSIRGLEKSISKTSYQKRARQKLIHHTFVIEYQNQMEERLFVLGVSRLSKEACKLARKLAKQDALFVQKFSHSNKRSVTDEIMSFSLNSSGYERNDEDSENERILMDENVDTRDEE